MVHPPLPGPLFLLDSCVHLSGHYLVSAVCQSLAITGVHVAHFSGHSSELVLLRQLLKQDCTIQLFSLYPIHSTTCPGAGSHILSPCTAPLNNCVFPSFFVSILFTNHVAIVTCLLLLQYWYTSTCYSYRFLNNIEMITFWFHTIGFYWCLGSVVFHTTGGCFTPYL